MKQDTFLSLLHQPAVQVHGERSHPFEQHFPIWELLGKLQGAEQLAFTLELIGVTVKGGRFSCPFAIGICLP